MDRSTPRRPHHAAHRYPTKPPPLLRWRIVLGGLAVIGVVLIFSSEPAPPGLPLETPPAGAVGRWTTGDPRYQDRVLVVGSKTVRLELGRGVPPSEGTLSAVRAWMEGGTEVVRLEYTTVEGPQSLEMLLESPQRMRLRNPSDLVWTRSR
jgi:hypothetical protein